MGFLDFLKKQETKSDKSVSLENLDAWLNQEFKSISSQKKKRIMALLGGYPACVGKLNRALDALESKNTTELDKRLLKIVKTNKPTYVHGMRKAVESIKNLNPEPDPEEFQKQLKEGLDLIGKLNFGEGRYLPAAYPNQMREIHAASKKILEIHDKTAGITGKTEYEKNLGEAAITLGQINECAQKNKEHAEKTCVLGQEIEKARKEYDRVQQKHSKALGEAKDPEITALEKTRHKVSKQLMETESELSKAYSRLARAFRKYQKHSAKDYKLAQQILDDPLEALLATNNRKTLEMLERFRQAVQDKQLKLKDTGKITEKTCELERLIKDDVRNKILGLREEKSRLQKLLENHGIREKIISLEREASRRKNIQDSLNEELTHNKKLIRENEETMGKLTDCLRKTLKQNNIILKTPTFKPAKP
jgi:hypothetical protein